MLKLSDVSVRYGEKTVLSRISMEVHPGQWLMLCGPNGAGKSTLVKTIVQAAAYTGKIEYENKDLSKMRTKDIAKKIGVLAQHNQVNYDFLVRDVVSLGCYSRSNGFWAGKEGETAVAVDHALSLCDLADMQNRRVTTLSGGELQRVFLAQVFAQNPQILILDEPANHLDLPYQQQLFQLLKNWLNENDRAVISVVHDLSLAKKYGTHALLLDKGVCAAQGTIEAAMTPENLQKVYRMDVAGWMRDMYRGWVE